MDLDLALDQLAADPALPFDAAELGLHLARDEYPDLAVADCLIEFDHLAAAVRPRLVGSLSDRVTALGRFLFAEAGFRGDPERYYDPANSYLNCVLQRRTGIPLSLSLVAMAVGRRAGLDVAGVALPGHFVVKARLRGRELLFDPFHGGRPLGRSACETLVSGATGEPFRATADALRDATAGQIVRRMLTNLKGIYLRAGDFHRAARVIERIRQLDRGDPLEMRDLGVSWLQAGHPGKAIDLLGGYLNRLPSAQDRDRVEALRTRAVAEVARWN